MEAALRWRRGCHQALIKKVLHRDLSLPYMKRYLPSAGIATEKSTFAESSASAHLVSCVQAPWLHLECKDYTS